MIQLRKCIHHLDVFVHKTQIYTWPDATLRELTELVKEVRPEARKNTVRGDMPSVCMYDNQFSHAAASEIDELRALGMAPTPGPARLCACVPRPHGPQRSPQGAAFLKFCLLSHTLFHYNTTSTQTPCLGRPRAWLQDVSLRRLHANPRLANCRLSLVCLASEHMKSSYRLCR